VRSDLARLQRSRWWSRLKPTGILQLNSNIPKPTPQQTVAVSNSFKLIITEISEHCNWTEQQATMCFLLGSNTKGHTGLGCSRAMDSFQVPDEPPQPLGPMQLILIGDLLAIPQGPYLTLLAGPVRSGLRLISSARHHWCPRSWGSFFAAKFLGNWQGLSSATTNHRYATSKLTHTRL